MEKWKEVFKDYIPYGCYQIELINGEENGLIIKLIDKDHYVILKFGVVTAFRVLDEGIVQSELYSDEEIERFKKNKFSNVIYEVKDGEFENQIQGIAGEYYGIFDFKHYIIITENYNIDILTEWRPEIEVVY